MEDEEQHIGRIPNRAIKEKSLLDKVNQKKYCILFLSNIIIDQLWNIKFHRKAFEHDSERRSYIILSFILFTLVLYYYFKLLLESPHQTCIESLQQKEPKRLFAYNKKAFDKQCPYCSNSAKHERSSHCSVCKICVLKRDHHCPWIDKCVGYTNLELFFHYLIWLIIYGLLYFKGFNNFYNNNQGILDDTSYFYRIPIYLTAITTGIAFLGTLYMIGEKFYEYLNGATYYEETKSPSMEKYFLCCATNMDQCNSYNNYNKGWLANLEDTFGPTILHALFPLPRMMKTDIMEEVSAFIPNAQVSRFTTIKSLSGIQYDSLQNIIAGQDEQTSPYTFMDHARTNYSHSSIKII